MSGLQVSIVTHDNADTIDACLESVLRETRDLEVRIDVIDNASTDGTASRIVEGFGRVRVERLERNVGFGVANNEVLRECRHPLALLINPDAYLATGAVRTMIERLEREPRTALVGPLVEYEDGAPQVSFGPFPGIAADARQRRLVRGCRARRPSARRTLEMQLKQAFQPDWISASCVLARVDALREVGLFDERYFLYVEDVDLCRRLRNAGWRVTVEPAARCTHREGGSPLNATERRTCYRNSRLLYEEQHGTRISAALLRTLYAFS